MTSNCMQIQLGEIESAGGYKLQDVWIFSHDGKMVTSIRVKLFDEASEALGPALELTIDPHKRVFESFDRQDHLYVAIGGEKKFSE
jgi:hypothetical protein